MIILSSVTANLAHVTKTQKWCYQIICKRQTKIEKSIYLEAYTESY